MPDVSVFRNVKDVTSPINMDLLEYLEKTRDGEWEDLVTKCRTITDKEKRDAFKRSMPTTTLSGIFTTRSDDGLVKHSGYISMDIDDMDDVNGVRYLLERDKYVASVFMSTSGTGLRVLFKIEPKHHRKAFVSISDYIYNNYGEVCDPNGVNVSKPYVVSYDPFTYINFEGSPVFKEYIKEKVVKPMSDFVYVPSDLDQVIKQISSRGVNICEDYSDWLKVGFALSEALGEDGRAYFHELSKFSQKYNQRTTDKQFNQCLKARGTSSKVNISSLYYLAKCNGISIVSEQTKTIIRTTKNGKQAGLSKEQIVKNLAEYSGIKNCEKVVEQVFESNGVDWADEEQQSLLPQLEMFISNNYNLRINEVTGYIEENGVALPQNKLNSIFISAKKLIPKVDYKLMMQLLKSDFLETYNPFYDFWKSDGIAVQLPAIPEPQQKEFESPLIDLLAKTIENDNPAYTSFFLRKWIVSVVSAAHKVHSPLLLALLGKQNSGKTEFFRRLLPKELSAYYAESKLDKGKDDELLMCESLIIMDDELSGKSKQESKNLNNITSKQWLSVRRPYGDHNEKILRIAVLCGTSNYKEILTDSTGNRRIIPVNVNNINKELYNSIDKVALWKEAFKIYKEGFDWRIAKNEDIKYLNCNKEEHEMIVKERDLIAKYFMRPEDVNDERSEDLTTTEILVDLEFLTRQKLNLGTLGAELLRAGYLRRSVRVNPYQTSKAWNVIKINRRPFNTSPDPF